jgi:RND family efflux transporter MFP subunit
MDLRDRELTRKSRIVQRLATDRINSDFPMSFRQFPLLAVSMLTAVAFAGCQQKNQFVPPPPPKVTVAKPLARMVTEYFETTGVTRAAQTVELRARVGGFLEQINFKDGDRVEKDALLFVIDKAPYEAALASAQAEQAKAEAQLRLSTAQLGRTRTLVERKAGTAEQLDVAEAERASAEADVASAKASVRKAQLDLDYTEIRAPFAGRIGRHQVDIGNLVTSGTTLLATIETVDPIHAYFNVSEADLLRFLKMQREGTLKISDADPIEIDLAIGEEGEFNFHGKLDFREFGVDPSTGTTTRRAVYENPGGRLVPGLFVRVRAAVGDPQPKLLVEERAVSSDQRGDYLLVVNAKNVVEYRPVKLGSADAGLRVIGSGLRPEDRIVINGLQRARPGAEVNPEEVKMAAIAGATPTEFRLSPPDTKPKNVAARSSKE